VGDHGPCGPCSELYYDRGDKFKKGESEKEERFVEFWNIVFMQNEKNISGAISPLATPCIDTGLGLERMCALLQDVPSVFETDLFSDIIQKIVNMSGKIYDPNQNQTSAPFRVIADHLRSVSFAIADGINPGNTQRGYIIRKLIRRALRYGKKLGLQEPFWREIFPVLEEKMGGHYPELTKNRSRILEILDRESHYFLETIRKGTSLMEELLPELLNTGKAIPCHIAFKLKDTYGMPLEEILFFAEENDLTVDLEGFQEEENKAKERSREGRIGRSMGIVPSSSFEKTPFLGYGVLETDCVVLDIRSESGTSIKELITGESGSLLLNHTTFYARQGGQVGDSGILENEIGRFLIEETRYDETGNTLHIGRVLEGLISKGNKHH
ncbi:alanine--tRNA ligase-related protein, partial [Candidatus Similichlamydia epinepheli]|uniref:alanine--tRNA ligase-related protein n=1 Tax=Candidatus Similichlamydia epinepheli TaxID=1903953 RepID=UPI001EFCA3B7